MTQEREEDGAIFAVVAYDDRWLRLWPREEAPAWAADALGLEEAGEAHVVYVMFIPAHAITPHTPDDWWVALLRPVLLDCLVKSVDEEGATVLGLGVAT